MIFTVGCSYWFVHQKKKLKKKFLEIVCSFQFYGGTRLCNVYCHYYFLFHHRDSGFIPNEFLRKSKLYLIWKRLFSLHVDYRGGKKTTTMSTTKRNIKSLKWRRFRLCAHRTWWPCSLLFCSLTLKINSKPCQAIIIPFRSTFFDHQLLPNRGIFLEATDHATSSDEKMTHWKFNKLFCAQYALGIPRPESVLSYTVLLTVEKINTWLSFE